VTYRQPRDSIGFSERVLNPRKEPMEHTDRFILPNITRVDYRFGTASEFIIVSQCTPVSALKTRVYTAIIYKLPILTKMLEPFMRFYTRRVIQQDVEIMANQGGNFRRDPVPAFNSTDADVVHESIEALRELAARGDPEAFTRARRTEKTIWI
jgi:hypothetical protein